MGRPWPHTEHETDKAWPAGLVHHGTWWIPMKLKCLAIHVIVMTAASTVLAKSVRFPKHVSPGCCAGIASFSAL